MALGADLLAALRSTSSSRDCSRKSPEPGVPSASAAVPVPSFFLCPITYEIMADPVTLDTGMTYDRASIEEWLNNGHNTCPSTNRTLLSNNLIPNLTLQSAIRNWCEVNRKSSNLETVSKLLGSIARCEEVGTFSNAAKELYAVAEESGRTRRTLRDLGAVGVLSQALVRLDTVTAEHRSKDWSKGLQYAVATIAMLHPRDEDDKHCLAAPEMMTIMASLLAKGSTTAKINAAKTMMSVVGEECDTNVKTRVGNHRGAVKGLLTLIRDAGLSAKETQLGLRCLLALLSPMQNRVVAINERAVHWLVELLPRAPEKRCAEYVFAILEVLANCAEGREAITNHPFAILRIVEYLHGVHGVSFQATECAVGTLHSVIELSSNPSVVNTALKAGAFTSLLMLLPSECSPRCKTKARDTLKLLNVNFTGRPGDDDFSVCIERGVNRQLQQHVD